MFLRTSSVCAQAECYNSKFGKLQQVISDCVWITWVLRSTYLLVVIIVSVRGLEGTIGVTEVGVLWRVRRWGGHGGAGQESGGVHWFLGQDAGDAFLFGKKLLLRQSPRSSLSGGEEVDGKDGEEDWKQELEASHVERRRMIFVGAGGL